MLSKVLSVALAALVVGACATRPQMIYVRLDGKPIPGNAALLETFNTDRTVCLGDMAKADLGGTAVPTGNVFIDAENKIERNQKTDLVMAACMAQKGYKLVSASPAAG